MANVTATVVAGKKVTIGNGFGATTYSGGDTVTLPSREKAVLVSQGIVT